MKLITKEVERGFQKYPLYSQGDLGKDSKVVAKFFDPMGKGTWIIIEGDQIGDDYEMFGLCQIDEPEYGYVMLSDLEKIGSIPRNVSINGMRVPMSLPVERDLYVPVGEKTVKEVYEETYGKGSYPFSFNMKRKLFGRFRK